MSVKVVRNVLLAISAIVLVWSFFAPLFCQTGTVKGLDGNVGTIDNWSLWQSLNPFSATIYVIGDFFCHQMESRVFMINGNEMPFCVRDIALLIGFAVGMVIVSELELRRSKRTDIFAVVSFALIIADWAFQHFTDTNIAFTRFVTGILAGVAIAFVICFILNAMAGEPSYRQRR